MVPASRLACLPNKTDAKQLGKRLNLNAFHAIHQLDSLDINHANHFNIKLHQQKSSLIPKCQITQYQ